MSTTGSGDAAAAAEKRASEVDRMRHTLDDWKEVFVCAKRILDWEETFYPGIIFGVVSLLFLLVWYLEPTFLSFLSLVGLLVTVADYLIPLVVPKIFPVENWNEEMQDRYSWICASLVGVKYESRALFFRFQDLKAQKPRLYLALTSVALLFLAWLGSALGDLTLLYVITLGASLYPGAIKNPVISERVNDVVAKVQALFNKEKAN